MIPLTFSPASGLMHANPTHVAKNLGDDGVIAAAPIQFDDDLS
jgi:hypothetical protein